MKRKILKENLLKSVIRKVLLEDKTWEEIAKSGSDISKSLADLMDKYYEDEKNKSTKSITSSKEPPSKTQSSSTKSTYDKKTDTLNKNLPEYTISATKPTIKGGTYIIDMNNPKSKDITVIWGGMPSSSYGAKFMREKATGYFNNKNVIYSNYENSLTTLKNILKQKGINNFRIKSVSGFSRGGINAWDNLNGEYDFVGLIDPSTPTAYDKLPSKAKMISKWDNWGCCPTYRRNIKQMETSGASKRIDGNGYNHLEMPEKFYKLYSNLM